MSGLDPSPGAEKGLLRFLTCGSVDDGKSTLIGRLLFDAGLVLADEMETLNADSKRSAAVDGIDFALLVDGLEAEREQGITIDVAYRFFSTARRSFIVADTPGHEQYTANMATGASTADLAVLLVDARNGVVVQTRRHARICALFGVRRMVLAVNKIDLVGFDEEVFAAIVADFEAFAADLGLVSLQAIPVSARFGDNVCCRSLRTPWYQGPHLLEYLETAEIPSTTVSKPFRFPVQWVNRREADFRGLAGTVASGTIRPGDAIVVAASGRQATLSRIVTMDGDLHQAEAGDAVTLVLDEDIDAGRGDLLSEPCARPQLADQFAAHLLWIGEEALLPGRSYRMRIGTRFAPAFVSAIKYRIDVNTNARLAARTLAQNEIGVVNVACSVAVAFDRYDDIRDTGAFILIDRGSNQTVAAGMIDFALRRAGNISPQPLIVDKATRSALKSQKPAIVWFTGLSGSGKSTIANVLEQKLAARGCHSMLLDGDNIRHGLNRDLGFTAADRVENIRRAGEVARLFVEAGIVVLCAFISPFAAERRLVRSLVEEGEFIEVFVDTPLDVCAERDPKGLYARARAGQIPNFTGFDSPYERPENAEVILETRNADAESLAEFLLAELCRRGVIDV